MKIINVLQVGLGPLGVKIGQFLQEREGLNLLAAIDTNSAIAGRDLGTFLGVKPNGIKIVDHIDKITNIANIDIAILSTISDLERIIAQIDLLLDHSLPIVSSCEELTYPWHQKSTAFIELDKKAKEKGVAVLATGVNPGFLMDTLPTMMTAVCQNVQHIHVNRFQDAQYRRMPFQQKIGAGLSLNQFEERKKLSTLRHVGLTESMYFIAHSLGWKIDKTEDVIMPVIAKETIQTPAMSIKKGEAMGVRQEGRAFWKGKEKIKLIFEAAVGSGKSFDEVKISGSPDLNVMIENGVNGDIATCAIILNAIPKVLIAQPGIKTMADVSLISYWTCSTA